MPHRAENLRGLLQTMARNSVSKGKETSGMLDSQALLRDGTISRTGAVTVHGSADMHGTLYDHRRRPDGLLMKRCWQLAAGGPARSAVSEASARCSRVPYIIPQESRASDTLASPWACVSGVGCLLPMSTAAALVYRDPSPQSQTRLQRSHTNPISASSRQRILPTAAHHPENLTLAS